MNSRFALAALAMSWAMHAHAAPPTPSDQWTAQSMARGAGMTPCEVRRALGEHYPVAAGQYNMSPASRGRIERVLRRYYDAALARERDVTASAPTAETCGASAPPRPLSKIAEPSIDAASQH